MEAARAAARAIVTAKAAATTAATLAETARSPRWRHAASARFLLGVATARQFFRSTKKPKVTIFRRGKNPHFSALFRKKRLTESAYLEGATWSLRSILNHSYEPPARGPTS
eukprot:6561574-Prymnesium_polylepis.1